MNTKKLIFIGAVCCATLPVLAESLLKPTKFPKTFADVDFADRMTILAEGYGAFDVAYDANGNCISGCAYSGLTFAADQQNTDDATAYFEDLVNSAVDDDDDDDDDVDTETPDATTPSDKRPKITKSSLPMRSPLKNSSRIMITSDFGFREYTVSGEKRRYFHTGIDIGVSENTPIYATGNGTVTKVTQDDLSGKYVEIKHSHGLYSQYLHLNTQNVRVGDTVRAGDFIGFSGNTGRSTGPHLHYQIWWNKGRERAFVDILCPCASSYRRNKEEQSHTNIDTSQYTCEHSALNHKYCFYGNEKEHRVDWRIKSKHCMDGSSRTQKLPDETGKCK